MPSKRFAGGELTVGKRKLSVRSAFLDVVSQESGVHRLDLRQTSTVATGIVDLDTPSGKNLFTPGAHGTLRVRDGKRSPRMQVLLVKLLGVEPSEIRHRKVYRWALLIVSRPVPDPFGLFADQLPEGEELSLATLADFLQDGTILQGTIARFNAEGGIQAAAVASAWP